MSGTRFKGHSKIGTANGHQTNQKAPRNIENQSRGRAANLRRECWKERDNGISIAVLVHSGQASARVEHRRRRAIAHGAPHLCI